MLGKYHERKDEIDLHDARQMPTNKTRQNKILRRKSMRKNETDDAGQTPAVPTFDRQDIMLHGKSKSRIDIRNLLFLSRTGFISTLLFLIVTFLIYDVVKHAVDVDFQALKTELTHNVHNQSEALSVIFSSLDKIKNQEESVSVVNFIGSRGVGKTFIANIIKRHFLPSVHEARGPLKPNTGDNILSTIEGSRYKYNLVVIDDLELDDVDKLLLFVKKLPQDVVVLVICIFTIQETDNSFNHKINYDHVDTIETKFKTAGLSHEVAKFYEFSKEEARAWIVKQLVVKEVDTKLHSKIVDSVLGNQNVKFHGLKGLRSKLSLEL